jgi:hypothetical protein
MARNYWPEGGRYVEADPLGVFTTASPTGTTSLNHIYGYANQNPLRFTDADGKNPLVVAAAIGAVVGGISGTIATGNMVGWSWNNAGAIAAGTGVGIVAGAAGTYAFGQGLLAYSTGALIGGAAGFFGNVAGQMAAGANLSCVDLKQAGFQSFVGLVSGLAAGPAFGPLIVNNPAVKAAVLTGATSLGINSVTSTRLGGFGFANVVQ